MQPSPIFPSSRSTFPLSEAEPEARGAPEPRSAPPAPQPPSPGAHSLVSAYARRDWCGSDGTGWVPDGGFGVDWSGACRTHDECYARPGADRGLCDYNLSDDMSLACASQDGGLLCFVAAGVYRTAVELFGDGAFERAQTGAKAASR